MILFDVLLCFIASSIYLVQKENNPITMKRILLKTKETLFIREAKIPDAALMIAYVKQVGGETDFLTFSPEEFTKTISEEEIIIENHHKAANQLFLLAWIDKELVGMLNVQASHKQRLRHVGEFGISVLKPHWGKGVATQLMQCMIDWARENKMIKKLSLVVQKNNTSAVGLYERFGFEVEGCLKRDFYLDGEYRDALLMALWLE